MSAYERRNERAHAAGWSGYGEQRRAKFLGYQAPREYREAKGEARREKHPTEPSPWAPMRTRGETTTASLGGGRRGIAGPWSDLGNVEKELARFKRDDRRITFYVGGQLFGKRGFTAAFIREMVNEYGSLEAWLEATAGTYGGTDSEPGLEAGGAVSVVVSP